MQTKLLYKVSKKEKLENNKRKIEAREIKKKAILETKPTPTVVPNLKKDTLIFTIEEKFNTLSDRNEKVLEDALDAHSHIAQIANPVLRESCHELVNADTRCKFQTAITEASKLKQTIPKEELKLVHVFEAYEDLLMDMVADTSENKNTHTLTATPSTKLTMGG